MANLLRLDYEPVPVLMFENPGDPRGFRTNACVKEPWTVKFIEDMPGPPAVFYDVGANVGSYTCLAGRLGKFVVAFEPSTPNFYQMFLNLQANHLLNQTILIPGALSDKNGLDWINYGKNIQAGGADHTIGGAAPGNQPILFHRQALFLWKLDDLVKAFGLPKPTHVKIDVDGGELAVLAGMPETLKTIDGLMLEFKPQQEADMIALLKGYGLEMVGRWDTRGGQPIGIVYGRFERVAA